MACSEFIRGLALNVNNKRTISVDGMTGIRKCTNSKEKNWRGDRELKGEWYRRSRKPQRPYQLPIPMIIALQITNHRLHEFKNSESYDVAITAQRNG